MTKLLCTHVIGDYLLASNRTKHFRVGFVRFVDLLLEYIRVCIWLFGNALLSVMRNLMENF